MQTLVAPCYDWRAIITSALAVLVRSRARWARPVILRVWEDYFCGIKGNGKLVFLEHNDMVRKLVSRNKLLEYRVGEDGWEPLCRFLDVPVPEETPFPNVNMTRQTKRMIEKVAWQELKNAATRVVWVAIFVVVSILLYQYFLV